MLDNVLAKEGQKRFLASFLLMIIFILMECSFLTFVFFVLTLALIFIYRNNTFKNNSKSSDIISPISGEIIAIDSKDNKKHLYIDVNLLDIHILRALEDGKFNVSYKRGLNLILSSLKAKHLNENVIIDFENSSMQLIPSIYNPKIEINQNTDLKIANIIGIFVQGQIIITLKNDLLPLVKIGDRIESGITVLANKSSKDNSELS
ncbi:MAG: hypothetical protein GY932_04300 [Arcobacter sp.]|nr:hypothetical protein [Arcobacter sp.]